MKINRSVLLAVTAALGVLLIGYALAKQFVGFSLDEKLEKTFFDGIFIAAIALFLYNRKLAADEKKAADAEKTASGDGE